MEPTSTRAAQGSRHAFACLAGHVIDHFDTTLYGLLAPVIAPLFFPKHDPVAALILAYALSALGIISRPAGAWYFGRQALKSTPKQAFALSLLGLSLITGCIGVLPHYGHIGVFAPVSLAVLRLAQGFFAAGEAAVAPYYYLHVYPESERTAKNSILSAMTIAGIFAASAAVWLVNLHPCPQDVWRIPFLLCLPLGLVSTLIRRSLHSDGFIEDPSVAGKGGNGRLLTPLSAIITTHRKTLLRIIAAAGFSYMTYAVPFVFLNAWVPLVTAIPAADMLGWNTGLLALDGLLLLVIALLRRRLRTGVMTPVALTVCIAAIPVFAMMPGQGQNFIAGVRIAAVILGVLFCAGFNAWQMRILPADVCYRTSGLAYSIGSEIFGRSLPAVCMAIWHFSGAPWLIGLYCALIAAAAVWAVREGHGQP